MNAFICLASGAVSGLLAGYLLALWQTEAIRDRLNAESAERQRKLGALEELLTLKRVGVGGFTADSRIAILRSQLEARHESR